MCRRSAGAPYMPLLLDRQGRLVMASGLLLRLRAPAASRACCFCFRFDLPGKQGILRTLCQSDPAQ
jgi:hypothetical protein